MYYIGTKILEGEERMKKWMLMLLVLVSLTACFTEKSDDKEEDELKGQFGNIEVPEDVSSGEDWLDILYSVSGKVLNEFIYVGVPVIDRKVEEQVLNRYILDDDGKKQELNEKVVNLYDENGFLLKATKYNYNLSKIYEWNGIWDNGLLIQMLEFYEDNGRETLDISYDLPKKNIYFNNNKIVYTFEGDNLVGEKYDKETEKIESFEKYEIGYNSLKETYEGAEGAYAEYYIAEYIKGENIVIKTKYDKSYEGVYEEYGKEIYKLNDDNLVYEIENYNNGSLNSITEVTYTYY